MNYAIYPKPSWVNLDKWSFWIRTSPWRIDAIIRDKYRCVDCHNGETKLLVHHIDKNPKNNIPNNLVTLCPKCHAIRHGMKKIRIIERLKEDIPGKEIRGGILTIIGNELGVTRERVRQVAKQNGYTMPHEVSKKERTIHCLYCGKLFLKKYYNSKFCRERCAEKFHFYKYNTLSICRECGLGFINPTSRSHRNKYYCGKTCQGKDIARKYGWGSPNNPMKRKYGNVENIKRDFKEPFTLNEFAKKYGYSGTVTACNTISRLKFQGIVENYKVRGLYRIKQNAAIDKSL